ncbi:MAG: sensor histidine kinase [Leucobacter sp.]
MTALIDDIEMLAGSQAHRLKVERVDIAELGQQIYRKASAISGHEWSLDAHLTEGEYQTTLDPSRITQAVLQLVDNAAKYSPEGSEIAIGFRSDTETVQFWVADQGSGIPIEAQQRIFDRFGRADVGRGIRGSGLGLPIVDAIARSHGGRVKLASSHEGSRFTIEIPTSFLEVAS